MARALRRLGFAGGIGSLLWVADDKFNDGTFIRNFRTVYVAGRAAIEYKMMHADNMDETHERVAQRLLSLCKTNGGLYIKLGQGIASMNHVLPPQYNQAFSVLHDQAPSVPYADVKKIFHEDMGKDPSDIFKEFDEEPVASASIAQVHRATLHDGRQVAVKVQKPYIKKQMTFDLLTYKCVVWWFEKIFDLPFYWTVDYTEQNIRKEADFRIEAQNAETAGKELAEYFGNEVYVPTLEKELTTQRVMVMEWIDGVKVTSEDQIKEMGLSVRNIVQRMVEVFGFQIFVSGLVHCDPHPGNIMVCAEVRKQPNGEQQLVLLDHGLYIQESEKFREAYCRLWKAIFFMDVDTMAEICKSWGIRDHEMFASMQLMKPFSTKAPPSRSSVSRKEVLHMMEKAKNRVRHLLEDTAHIPRELIFVGRNINIVRSNNKHLGSPVNRVNVMARFALLGTVESSHQKLSGLRRFLEGVGFRINLLVIEIMYTATQMWSYVNSLVGRKVGSFEDQIEHQMQRTLHETLGFKVDISTHGHD